MDRSALGDVVHRRKRRILAYVRSSGCRKIEVVRRLQIKRRASASRLARINRRLGRPPSAAKASLVALAKGSSARCAKAIASAESASEKAYTSRLR
jgi:hypothetical protein